MASRAEKRRGLVSRLFPVGWARRDALKFDISLQRIGSGTTGGLPILDFR